MAHHERGHWRPGVEHHGRSRAERTECDYDAYLPDPLHGRPLTLTGPLAADLADAERAVTELNIQPANLDDLESLARVLLRADAVASSRMEGIATDAGRLYSAESDQLKGRIARRDMNAIEILGNINAMRHALDEIAPKPRVELEDLLEIHRQLMRETRLADIAGQIRTKQNWIGTNPWHPCNAEFIPPPPQALSGLLADLVEYINDDNHPALAHAALAHAQFETLHPFADGNGRVGRVLIHLILRRRGLAPRYVPPISLALAANASLYVEGLTATRYLGAPDSQAATAGIARWLETFTGATLRATIEAGAFALELQELDTQWRRQVSPRKNSAADLLIARLPQYPILTARTAALITGRTDPAAHQAINQLAAAGVLRPITTAARYRAYEAPLLLDALADFEERLNNSPAR